MIIELPHLGPDPDFKPFQVWENLDPIFLTEVWRDKRPFAKSRFVSIFESGHFQRLSKETALHYGKNLQPLLVPSHYTFWS